MKTDSVARVLVVDDHPMFAEALAQSIDGEADLRFVASVQDLASAAVMLQDAAIDVVVLDLELAGESGLDLLRTWHEKLRDTKFVLLVASVRRDTVAEALALGASAVISKNRPSDDLIRAIQAARLGRTSILVEGLFDEPTTHDFALTDREFGILQLLAQGRADNDIAADLCISRNTVRTHVRRLFAKLGATSRVEAVATARRCGVLEP